MLNTFNRPEISMNYILIEEGVPLIVGGMVLEISRKTLEQPEHYLGFETEVKIARQVPVGESTGVDVPGQLWSRYHREKHAVAPYLKGGMEMGMSHAADPSQGTFLYFAGGLAETVSENKTIPDKLAAGFMERDLPAGEYIICRIEAENFENLVTTALDQANKYLFETWLPRHGLTTEPFSAEKYYRDMEDMACMEIWVRESGRKPEEL